MKQRGSDFYSFRNIVTAIIISLAYLVLSCFLIGFKTDQLILAGIFNACFFASPVSRKLIIGFSIFIVYWILFDYMKAFPNYRFNDVHIADLYNTEKQLFGLKLNGSVVTPNEYWRQNGNSFLDVMTGIFYLCWIPVPLAFAAYLFFIDKNLFLRFSLTFVLVNLLGFIIYYVYPAAPPWYYYNQGATFIAGTIGNTAGLQKFDDYFDIAIFQNIYQKSSNVFAAMPSLHSSYPLLVVYYGLKKRVGWINIVFVLVTLGIWFAAVYTSHHYILDVLAGIGCAILGILIFDKILLKIPAFKRFLSYFSSKI
jgi:inositol phosphorylceramide synthase catalytic subunit